MKSVKRKIEGGRIRFKNILYKCTHVKNGFVAEVLLVNGIPDPDFFTPVSKASYYKEQPLSPQLKQNPSRDPYSHTPEGFVDLNLQDFKKPRVKHTSPRFSLFVQGVAIVAGCLATLFVMWVLIWEAYILTDPYFLSSSPGEQDSVFVDSESFFIGEPENLTDESFYTSTLRQAQDNATLDEGLYIDSLMVSEVLNEGDSK